MPCYVHEKCDGCGKWDWFMLNSDSKYMCHDCKRKKNELEIDMLEKIKKECE